MSDQQVDAAPGWYAQPNGDQMYWDGGKYTATWGETGTVMEAPPTNEVSAPRPVRATPSATEPSFAAQPAGFFASLFDFTFTTFITLRILSVIYTVALALVLVGAVITFAAVFSQGGWYILFGCVVVPLAALIYLVLIRVSLEMVALFFRIGENTSLMVAKL